MGQVVSSASTSSDGFIANPHHTVGSLFDRYNTGDIKVSTAEELASTLTPQSAQYSRVRNTDLWASSSVTIRDAAA